MRLINIFRKARAQARDYEAEFRQRRVRVAIEDTERMVLRLRELTAERDSYTRSPQRDM